MQINIKVRGFIASLDSIDARVVGRNTAYTVHFDFDEAWDAAPVKTARFLWGGNYTDVVLVGDSCTFPMIDDVPFVTIGVYSEAVQTTSGAHVPMTRSILAGSAVPAAPTPGVYDQIIALLNETMVEVEADADRAASAATNASLAQTAAETAQTAAETAADNAAGSANTATSAAETAQAAAAEAQTAKAGAVVAQAAAETAKTVAETARTVSEAAAASSVAAKTAAETAVDRYPRVSTTTGNWEVWSVSAGAWQDTGVQAQGEDGQPGTPGADGQDGADGITPTIGTNGNWYLGDTDTGKPSRGQPGQDGQPGSPGADGQDGQDGYSPAVTISTVAGGHRVTITDKTHPSGQSFDVQDGEDGAPGTPGTPGADGADGKSAYESAQDGGYTGTEAQFNSDLAAVPSKLSDAPSDGKQYARKDGAWAEVTGGGGGADLPLSMVNGELCITYEEEAET